MKSLIVIAFLILTTNLFADETFNFNAELHVSSCTDACMSPMKAEIPVEVVLKSKGESDILFGQVFLNKEIDGLKVTGILSVFKLISPANKYLIQSQLIIETIENDYKAYPLGSVVINSENDLNLIAWKHIFSNNEETYISSIAIQSLNSKKAPGLQTYGGILD